MKNKNGSIRGPEWLDWICDTSNHKVLNDKYDRWANHYDADVKPEWQHVLEKSASMLEKWNCSRAIEILDAGAGTGLFGKLLSQLGYSNITAVDFSSKMLEVAQKKGVYREIIQGDLLSQELFPANRKFDVITAMGLFAEAHADADVLVSLNRLLKYDGVFILTSREGILEKMEKVISSLQITLQDKHELPIYSNQKMQICVYKKVRNFMYSSPLSPSERFVSIEQRTDRSDMPASLWRPLTERYNDLHWNGVIVDKCPFQLAAIPILMQKENIKTVIELGSGFGGSAIWLADQLSLHNSDGKVISVDIDIQKVDPKAKVYPNIRFLQGDSWKIADLFPETNLSNLPHPWLILEDAHVNLDGVLQHFHCNGLCSGDYVVVEDTNADLWKTWSDWPDSDYIKMASNKMVILRNWLKKYPDIYLVDTLYQDLFGYNVSKCWNSILRYM